MKKILLLFIFSHFFIYQLANANNTNKINTFTQEEINWIKQNPIVKVGGEMDWAPFDFVNEKDEYTGITKDYLDLITKKSGLKFEVITGFTWNELINEFINKRVDILPAIYYSQEREKLGNYTSSYFTVRDYLFVREEENKIKSMSDLNGKVLAIPAGYTTIPKIKERFPDIQILETRSIADSIASVLSNQADATLEVHAVMSYTLRTNAVSGLKIVAQEDFEANFLQMLVQKDQDILLSILNKSIFQIDIDEQNEIANKWISQTNDFEITKQIFILVSILVIVILLLSYRQVLLNKTNEAIKDENEKFKLLLDATMEGIFISKDKKCIDVNDSALNIFAYENKSDMIGKELLEFVADESKDIVKQNLANNSSEPYEIIVLKSNGERFPAYVAGRVLEKAGIRISTVLDISHLKQLEEQSKNASMGEMIGNIAHQWRQPLSIVASSATGMKLQVQMQDLAKDDIEKYCDVINENAQFLSRTIDDFSNFISGRREYVKFLLKDTIYSFISLVNPSVKRHGLNIVLNVDENIELFGYPNELIQCLINLFNNSKDAYKTLDNVERKIYIDAIKVEDEIIIRFRDFAGGIKEEILTRVFEPYFTTKHKSQGTGIGLHMTYNLVTKGMNGKISASNVEKTQDTRVLKGVEFTIVLNT